MHERGSYPTCRERLLQKKIYIVSRFSIILKTQIPSTLALTAVSATVAIHHRHADAIALPVFSREVLFELQDYHRRRFRDKNSRLGSTY